MAYLNADIPPIYCKIRKEYLYDFKNITEKSEDCCIFGLTLWQALHLISHYGTKWCSLFRLPYQRFFEKFDRCRSARYALDELQLWNCFSYYPSVHCFGFLSVKRGKYFGKDKKNYHRVFIYH